MPHIANLQFREDESVLNRMERHMYEAAEPKPLWRRVLLRLRRTKKDPAMAYINRAIAADRDGMPRPQDDYLLAPIATYEVPLRKHTVDAILAPDKLPS